MKEINLKIAGMVCSGCENRIKNALKRIDGVQNVTANHESGIVTVTSTDEIKENFIVETIKNLGYEIIKED